MKAALIGVVLAVISAGMFGSTLSGCMTAEKAQEISSTLKGAAATVEAAPVPSPWKEITSGALNLAAMLFSAYAAHKSSTASATADAAHQRLDGQAVPAAAAIKVQTP